jgi:hypothetical protein
MTLGDASRFGSNTGEVAASLMDGEAVLINLSTGVYYSTDNVGAMIWQLADLGFSVEEIVDSVARRYGTPADRVRNDTRAFLQEMVDERIILPGAGAEVRGVYQSEDGDGPPAYETPVLHVYRDMGDLLALDAPMPNMEEIPWKGKKGDG